MAKIPKNYKEYKISVDNKQNYYATTDLKNKTVSINVKKHHGDKKELNDTIAHEKAHIDNPQASERQIEKEHKSNSLRDTSFRGMI